MYNYLSPTKLLFSLSLISLTLTACQNSPSTSTLSNKMSSPNSLIGCYTIIKTEPAQIKINEENGGYSMQMRQFNDPDKPWDKPEPLKELSNTEYKNYFNVDEKSIEKSIVRPDKVFALAKIQDSLMNLDKQFDSNYLGYIAKSETAKGNSTTVYKVDCGR